MVTTVIFSPLAEKQLRKAPEQVRAKLRNWAGFVETFGLTEVRQRPGFHDEPIKGQRSGQRSIRLNRQWRALYTVASDGTLILVTIEEVTAHDYRTR